MHTYFDQQSIILANRPELGGTLTIFDRLSKASKKDCSVTEAMTDNDVDLVSRAQYKAIQ
jgi:hypothetical protein